MCRGERPFQRSGQKLLTLEIGNTILAHHTCGSHDGALSKPEQESGSGKTFNPAGRSFQTYLLKYFGIGHKD